MCYGLFCFWNGKFYLLTETPRRSDGAIIIKEEFLTKNGYASIILPEEYLNVTVLEPLLW